MRPQRHELKRENGQTGFSLVELTVVLLIITLLASVAVRETSELAFQTRYEQTKERLEMIKHAILGNPRQITNGQQAISGFVADMGRLPDELRELLQPGFCRDNTNAVKNYKRPIDCRDADPTYKWVYSNTPCSDGIQTNRETCQALIPSGVWIGKQVDPTGTGLIFGWQGPYLSISGNVDSNDALTDGWGRTEMDDPATLNMDESKTNYGWFFRNKYLLTGNSNDKNDLIIQSFGKNQQKDGGSIPLVFDYDNDYPENVNPSIGGIYYAAPSIIGNDWLVDISGGIKAHIKLPLNGTRQIPSVSFCTDSSKTTKTTCTTPATWFGGCEDQTYYNKESCEGASKNWHSCSDETSSTKSACETAGAVWYGQGFGCEDQTKITKSACESAGKTWRSCTDDGSIASQSACIGAQELWYGESLVSIGDKGGCNDVHYTNRASCVAASKTWHACSIASVADFLECEAKGGYWLGNGYGCSDQQYSNQSACESHNKVWFESWPRCKAVSPDTEALVPYHNIKTTKQSCENDISGSWKYPRRQVCLNVFYFRNGGFVYTKSLPAEFKENGINQTIQFDFEKYNNQVACEANNGIWNSAIAQCNYAVPIGQNAIGVYEYTDNDGDGIFCEPGSDMFYPNDRQNPIQVDFRAHTTLPVINW